MKQKYYIILVKFIKHFGINIAGTGTSLYLNNISIYLPTGFIL